MSHSFACFNQSFLIGDYAGIHINKIINMDQASAFISALSKFDILSIGVKYFFKFKLWCPSVAPYKASNYNKIYWSK